MVEEIGEKKKGKPMKGEREKNACETSIGLF